MTRPARTSPPFPGLQRIRTLSRWVRGLCLLGGLISLGLPLALWSQPDWLAGVARHSWATGDYPLQLDWNSRGAGMLVCLLPAGLLAAVLYQVWALFGHYARGEVLSLACALHLRRAALGLLALAPALPLAHTLSVLALTLGNPKGQQLLSVSLSPHHYLTLLCGLVLLAIAQVMREAVRMAEENAEFV